MENNRKWRYGKNRWFVLLFIILAVIAARFFPPTMPPILMPAEKLSAKPLFNLPVIGDFYLTNTLTTLIVVNIVIILLAWVVRRSLRDDSLVPHGISGAIEMLVELIYNMTETTAGRFSKTIFPWFASLVVVVLISNWMGLIPGMEAVGLLEPAENGKAAIMAGPFGLLTNQPGAYKVVAFFRSVSTDLNYTIALALISVIATQIVGVQAQGWRYIYRFFNVTTLFSRPGLGILDFVVSLLELVSEFSKILSFAFRLFGNMFAGMVLLFLITSMVPVFAPSAMMLFEAFIGAIQALVFGMLTLVFMTQATQGHGGESHPE